MLRRATAAGAGTACLLTLVAGPATAFTEPVDVEIDIYAAMQPGSPMKTFRNDDVTIGPGPELTADDLVHDDGVCGSVEVDIDPESETISFTAAEVGCRVAQVGFAIVTTESFGWTVLRNDLVHYEPAGESHWEIDAVPATAGVWGGAWWVAEGQQLVLSGSTLFSYERGDASPPPTAAPTPTPTPTATPAPPAPATPARPVVARPTFTG